MSLEREAQLATAIGRLPSIKLGYFPTPLEPLPRLSAALGGPPIYVKRDDLTGLAFGGNKTRMLELSLAAGMDRGIDTVVMGAAVQSNYCRQLAAACAKLGLTLHLLLRPERPEDQTTIQGNHFLHRLFGAQVTILPDNNRAAQQAAVGAYADELRRAGKRVYVPRQPDTVDLDAIAYAEVALEIVQQARTLGLQPAYLYTTAYDTTQAGLVLGLHALGRPFHVRGITPTALPLSERQHKMVTMANQGAERLGLPLEFHADDFETDDRFIGERYGVASPASLEAVHLLAKTEGILIDPVYTGKGLAGLIAHIRQGQLDPTVPVIFLHTGGAPALFAFVEDVLAYNDSPVAG
jgi:1-aminocyclopropane-1-carboxylate deaminase/D-cysteine desulfhydrase-like pyridoxal-dependent ACC family enzyme